MGERDERDNRVRVRFEREWDERVNGSKEKRGRREKRGVSVS